MKHSPPPRIVSLLSGSPADAASYAFWGMGVTLCAGFPEPEEPEDTLMFVARLSDACDILLLPLSLCKEVSLYIARQVHRQRAPFRTVLFTGSFTATAQTTTPLFDYSLSSRSVHLADILRQAARTPAPARLGNDAVERLISRLIQVESCFTPQRIPLFERMSLDDVMARDRRYSAAMDDLARFRATGQGR